MSSWKAMKERLLEDEERRAAYDELEQRMRLVRAVIVARNARGWSQRDLAQAAGLKQPAIARFEKADSDPRLGTVTKILSALQLQLTIDSDGVAGAKAVERKRVRRTVTAPPTRSKATVRTKATRTKQTAGGVTVLTQNVGGVYPKRAAKSGQFVEIRTSKSGASKGVKKG